MELRDKGEEMKYPYTFEEYRKEVMKQFKEYYPNLYTEDDEDINDVIKNDYNSRKGMYEEWDTRYFKDTIELEVKPTVCCISMF